MVKCMWRALAMAYPPKPQMYRQIGGGFECDRECDMVI
jgi:hypothetical protein